MRADPDNLEFVTFCKAVDAWLRAAPSLDPGLAAAADVVSVAPDVERLAIDMLSAADTHRTLGASTLLTLWEANRAGRLTTR
jgi:hypothetical protein